MAAYNLPLPAQKGTKSAPKGRFFNGYIAILL
jgi:hypothetical protein